MLKRKFHRKRDQRRAFMKILANNLIENEKITTTLVRAKELKSFIEKIISKAKKQDLNALRYLLRFFNKRIAFKVFYDISQRYKERNGGYVRIIKLGKFRKDGAELATIEFV
jgi:large subunit ribosomal protein L17